MMDLFGIAIGVSVALIIFVLAMWKKQWWIFMTDGLIWFILMAFTFTQYTTDDMMYWFGYVYLILAIICIGCIFWFREKHEPIIEEPEETQEDKREKRSKKLSSLRNLGHKVSGKDY
jgi:Ca2+/Na+ antiporter